MLPTALAQLPGALLPVLLPVTLYLISFLCSLLVTLGLKRNARKFGTSSRPGATAHDVGKQMHDFARPGERAERPLIFHDAPFAFLFVSGFSSNVVVTSNSRDVISLVTTLHEVGHHLDCSYVDPPAGKLRAQHIPNSDEEKLMRLGLACLPIFISIAVFEWTPGPNLDLAKWCVIIAVLWTVAALAFYRQKLNQERRAWHQAETYNDLFCTVSKDDFLEIKRAMFGSYKNIPNVVWFSVLWLLSLLKSSARKAFARTTLGER